MAVRAELFKVCHLQSCNIILFFCSFAVYGKVWINLYIQPLGEAQDNKALKVHSATLAALLKLSVCEMEQHFFLAFNTNGGRCLFFSVNRSNEALVTASFLFSVFFQYLGCLLNHSCSKFG